jgi:polyhydroxybutyrate depolymerase
LFVKALIGIIVLAAVLAGLVAHQVRRIPQPIQVEMPGNRRALLYRLQGGPRPTLMVLHPYSGDALSTAKYSGFLQAAIQRGFNVVVPNAIGHEWHDSPDETPSHSNDIAFLASLAEKLVAEGIADPQRVFIAGISNGGMMAFALAGARPDLFAGIGTISGGMPGHAFASFRSNKPTALVMINGDADDVLPYAGGQVGDPSGFFRTTAGVEETAALLAKRYESPATREPQHTQIRDGKRLIERIDWSNGSMYPFVTVVKVVGGRHDVIGWRTPIEAFFGLPPRGPATPAAIVERFAEVSSEGSWR